MRLELPRALAVCGSAQLAGQAAAAAALAGDDRRQRRQMSHAARMAATVLREVLARAGWQHGREEVGAFFGVGGSGADLSELTALLAGSEVEGRFSLQQFGERGLGAANPLLAFQLMNNFTLCHGAIQCGLGGPSSAFFSRGAGTVTAIRAAAWSILDGDCRRAVAGGADSALHPVTLAELRREGAVAAGLVPDEGAAAVALADDGDDAAARVELFACGVLPTAALPRWPATEAVVVTAALPQQRDRLCAELQREMPQALVELAPPGETLAAAPALALHRAIELLADSALRQVAVLSLDLDGELGVLGLRRRQ